MSLVARKNDIARFFLDSRMATEVYSGQIKIFKVCDLILRLIGHTPDERGPLSRRGLRDSIRKHLSTLVAGRADAGNLRMSDASFDVDILPD
eukprot:4494083-Pyramimonas_sp.AAC.1